MNKKEMVKAILGKGILITPDLLDKLNEDTLQSILQNADKTKLVLETAPETKERQPVKPEANKAPETTANPISKPTADPIAQSTKPTISIKIRQPSTAPKLSPEDFVKYYNNKYNSIKNILLKKTDALSINKVNNSTLPVAVIGIVKEKTPNGFVLEDPTSEMEVIAKSESENITEDDVLAVKGNAREGKLFGKEIILPDVPLTHPVGGIDATLFITGKPPNTPENIDVVCSPEKIIGPDKTNSDIPNPAWITITKQEKSVRFLVYKPGNETTISDAVEMLKKRHLSPRRNQVASSDDPFLIDPVPDVFWINSKERGFKAYKGVTVISCGQDGSARIDLATKKVDFLD